jgi:HK97 family phage prohead protease
MLCKETHFTKQDKIEMFTDAEGGRHVRGYGALFYDGTPDTEYNQGDMLITRIMPGSLSNSDLFSADVHAYFNHDPNHVLGRTTAGTLSLRVDEMGLYYDITLPDTQLGRDLAVSLDRGDIRGASVTIAVNSDGEKRSKSGKTYYREITKAELFEVGPVTNPAFKNTSASLFSKDIIGEIENDIEKAETIELHNKMYEKRNRDLAILERV